MHPLTPRSPHSTADYSSSYLPKQRKSSQSKWRPDIIKSATRKPSLTSLKPMPVIPPSSPNPYLAAYSSKRFLNNDNTQINIAKSSKNLKNLNLKAVPYPNHNITPINSSTPNNRNSVQAPPSPPTEKEDLVPPVVTPFAMKTRLDKSLENKNCCFCEESLEYTLDGEKVIVIKCGHVCHYECLYELVDTSVPISLEEKDSVMPYCSTCGEPSIPLDDSLHTEIIQKKAMDQSIIKSFDEYELSEANKQLSASNPRLNTAFLSDPLLTPPVGYSDEATTPLHSQYSGTSTLNSSPYDSNNYSGSYKDLAVALSSPVANFTEALHLHQHSTSVQSAISPWDFDQEINKEIHYIEVSTPHSPPHEDYHFKANTPRRSSSRSTSQQSCSNLRLVSTLSDASFPELFESPAALYSAPCNPLETIGEIAKIPYTPPNGEISAGIPNKILQTRLRKFQPPKVSIVTETDSIYASKLISKDTYISSLISITIPERPRPENDPYLNQPPEIDVAIRKQLTDYVTQITPDKKDLNSDRFGMLRLHDTFLVSRDQHNWQLLDCYLFETILVFVRVYPNVSYEPYRPPKLKGSVCVKEHLVSISLPQSTKNVANNVTYYSMNLDLLTEDLPNLYLKTTDPIVIENWHTAFMNWDHKFPLTRLVREDDFEGLSIATQMYPDDYDHAPLSPKAATSSHIPVDTVILVPISASPMGSKFPAIKSMLHSIIQKAKVFDRVAIVPYGSSSYKGSSPITSGVSPNYYGLASGSCKHWSQAIESLQPALSRSASSDLIDALDVALSIFEDRKSLNPVSSIVIVSDSAGLNSATRTEEETGLDALASHYNAIDQITDKANLLDVSINTFGVTINHPAQDLNLLATKTKGSYHYLRGWSELCPSVLGQFKYLQSMSYKNVSLNIETNGGLGTDDSITITEVSGYVANKTEKSKLKPGSALNVSDTITEEFTESSGVREHLVELGNMAAGETKTFLVQLRIPPTALATALNEAARNSSDDSIESSLLSLFQVSMSYRRYTSSGTAGNLYFFPGDEAIVKVETNMQDLLIPYSAFKPVSPLRQCQKSSERVSHHFHKHRESYSSSIYSCYSSTCSSSASSFMERPTSQYSVDSWYNRPQSRRDSAYVDNTTSSYPIPQVYIKPSNIFGDLVACSGSDNSDQFLSLELYDIRIVQRRIELIAANLFQMLSQFKLEGSNSPSNKEKIDQTLATISQGRSLIQGLLGSAVACKSSDGNRLTRIITNDWTGEDRNLQQTINDTKQLAAIVDKILNSASEYFSKNNLLAYEQDYQKLITQYVDILRNQRAVTDKTPLERLYLKVVVDF